MSAAIEPIAIKFIAIKPIAIKSLAIKSIAIKPITIRIAMTHFTRLPRSSSLNSTLLKRSSQVSLVLIGSVATLGCGDTHTSNSTYEYENEQDCVKDWGETECQRQGERHHSGMFLFYASGYRHSPDQARHAKSVKRGGFGSRFSSGGS